MPDNPDLSLFFYRSKGRHYSCIVGLDIPKPCSLSPEIFNHIYAYIYLFYLFCYLFTYFVSLFYTGFLFFLSLFKRTMLKTQNVSSHQLNFKNDRAVQF